jgi:hypothetical protein
MRKELRRFITDVGAALPTAELKHLGTIALKRSSGAVAEWHGVGQSAAGAARWDRLLDKIYADTLYSATGHSHASTGITVAEGGTPLDTDITTLDFDASDFNLTESPENEVNIVLAYGTSAGTPAEGNHNHDAVYSAIAHTHSPQYVLTIGPFYEFNIPAATTAEMDGLFLSGATTVGSDAAAYDFRLNFAGEIIGMSIISTEPRTAGTITPKVRLSGVNTDFAANACQINGTTSITTSWFVAPGGGVSFSSSDSLGMSLVASATWSPTTADHIAYMYARLNVI